MLKRVKDLKFINKYTKEEIYLLVNRIYFKLFNMILFIILKRKIFKIKNTINKNVFKKLVFSNLKINKKKAFNKVYHNKKRYTKKKLIKMYSSNIVYYFTNYFLIDCFLFFNFFFNNQNLLNKKINKNFHLKFSVLLLSFLKDKNMFLSFIEKFSKKKKLVKWIKFLYKYNIINKKFHKRGERYLKKKIKQRAHEGPSFHIYLKNKFKINYKIKKKKISLFLSKINKIKKKKKKKNRKSFKKFEKLSLIKSYDKYFKETVFKNKKKIKRKKEIEKQLKNQKKINIIKKNLYLYKKKPFWKRLRRYYSKFYKKLILIHTLRRDKIIIYNYFINKYAYNYPSPFLNFYKPSILKALKKGYKKSRKFTNLLKSMRKLRRRKQIYEIKKFFFLPIKYDLSFIRFFNFLWLKVYNNNININRLKLLKPINLWYLNLKIFRYFYYNLNLIYKDHYYSCIIKKKRSNVYITLINRLGDVIDTYSSGRVWTLRRRKIRKSLRSLTLMINVFSKKIISTFHIKTIFKLYLQKNYKRFYKRVSKEFLKNGIKVKNLVYIKSRPHGLLNRAKKIRRL